MSRTNLRTTIAALLDRACGPYAYSLQTYLVVVIPATFLAVLADPARNDVFLPAWVAVVVSAAVFAGVFFLVFGRIVFMPLTGLNRTTAAILGFVITGIIRGGLIGFLGLASGVVSEVNWQFRFVGGALLAAVLFPIAATLVNDFFSYRSNLAILTNAQTRLRELTLSAQAELDAERASMLESINERLSMAVKEISHDATPGQSIDSYRSLVTNLLTVAETVVKPLSQQLLKGVTRQLPELAQEKITSTNLRTLLVSATVSAPIRPFPVTAIWALIGASTISSLKPGFPGFLAYPLFVFSTFAILWLGKQSLSPFLSRWSVSVRSVLILAVYVLVSIIPAILSWIPLADLQREGFGSLSITLLILDPIATLFMCIALAVLAGLKTVRQDVLDDIETTNRNLQWRLASIRGLLRAQRMELSRSVHGDVQSVFIAVALKLQTAIATGTVSDEVLAEARNELQSLTSFTIGAKQYPSFDKAIDELRSLWGEAVSITASLDPLATAHTLTNDILRTMLTDVCAEAVTNAVKHGNANQIAIAVREEGTSLKLTVTNNGAALKPSRRQGAGSKLIEEVAVEYSLQNTTQGVVLEVMLPISRQENKQ